MKILTVLRNRFLRWLKQKFVWPIYVCSNYELYVNVDHTSVTYTNGDNYYTMTGGSHNMSYRSIVKYDGVKVWHSNWHPTKKQAIDDGILFITCNTTGHNNG